MQASPLEIEGYYIESLRWELSPDFRGEAKREPLRAADLKCELQRADLDAPRAVAFRLSLEVDDSAQDYLWKIVLVGHFRLNDAIPAEQVEKIFDANAPALLYSAAREAIANALSRGLASAPLLPSVNFLNFQRDETSSAETRSAKTSDAENAPNKAAKTATAKTATAKTVAAKRKAALPAAKVSKPLVKATVSKPNEP